MGKWVPLSMVIPPGDGGGRRDGRRWRYTGEKRRGASGLTRFSRLEEIGNERRCALSLGDEYNAIGSGSGTNGHRSGGDTLSRGGVIGSLNEVYAMLANLPI